MATRLIGASGAALMVLGGYVGRPSLSELWDSFPIGTGVGLHTWATLMLCLLAIGTGFALFVGAASEGGS